MKRFHVQARQAARHPREAARATERLHSNRLPKNFSALA
jgi:hypothetical protein